LIYVPFCEPRSCQKAEKDVPFYLTDPTIFTKLARKKKAAIPQGDSLPTPAQKEKPLSAPG